MFFEELTKLDSMESQVELCQQLSLSKGLKLKDKFNLKNKKKLKKTFFTVKKKFAFIILFLLSP